MRRQQWDNLNGLWELQEVSSMSEEPPFGQTLKERVLVPFPIESDLSGRQSARYSLARNSVLVGYRYSEQNTLNRNSALLEDRYTKQDT